MAYRTDENEIAKSDRPWPDATTTLKPGERPLSELERLNAQLNIQRDMLSVLESKLDPVSDRGPREEEVDRPSEKFHINTLISELIRNNRRIDQLISEIVL